MSHVYLSYSRRDADFVDRVEADLNEQGHPVWRDVSGVQQDERWDTAIAAALDSAYAVLVVLSRNGLDSDWVAMEMAVASRAKTPFVVLLMEPCDLPQALRDGPMVDMSRIQGATGLDQLRQYRLALQSLIGHLDELYPVRRHLMALEHTDDRVREEAARTLGDLGDSRSSEALIQRLSDPDIDVRFAAAEALGKLKSQSAQKSLVRLTNTDDDPDVRAAAAAALGDIELPGAIAPLMEQLEHTDRFVRQAAISAL